MHYPDSRWPPCCQGKSRDDVFGRIAPKLEKVSFKSVFVGPVANASPGERSP